MSKAYTMSCVHLQNVSLKTPVDGRHPEAATREYILRDITFEIPLGTVFTILGPSGSGKTSLLRLINRLNDPTSGEIRLDGEPLDVFEPTALRRRIGYVFQVPTMLSGVVRDNLAYGLNLGRSSRDGEPARDDLVKRLRQVALDESFLDCPADRLSVGEQQRVSIARSLMTSPEILLMDEPTAALDPTATSRLLDLIGQLHKRNGLTIVFVTHQLEQAQKVGEQTAILIEGRLIECAPTAQLFDSPKTQEVRDFLAGRLGAASSPSDGEEAE